MKQGLSDTSVEFEKIYLDKIGQLTDSQRLRRALEMSNALMNRSFSVLREENPDLSKNELGLLFIKIHYGDELYNMCKSIMIDRGLIDKNRQDDI